MMTYVRRPNLFLRVNESLPSGHRLTAWLECRILEALRVDVGHFLVVIEVLLGSAYETLPTVGPREGAARSCTSVRFTDEAMEVKRRYPSKPMPVRLAGRLKHFNYHPKHLISHHWHLDSHAPEAMPALTAVSATLCETNGEFCTSFTTVCTSITIVEAGTGQDRSSLDGRVDGGVPDERHCERDFIQRTCPFLSDQPLSIIPPRVK